MELVNDLSNSSKVSIVVDKNGIRVDSIILNTQKNDIPEGCYVVPPWREDDILNNPYFDFTQGRWRDLTPEEDLLEEIRITFNIRTNDFVNDNIDSVEELNHYITIDNKKYMYIRELYKKYKQAFNSLIQGESFPLKLLDIEANKEVKKDLSWDNLRKFNLYLINAEENMEDLITEVSEDIYNRFITATKDLDIEQKLEMMRTIDIDRMIKQAMIRRNGEN